MEFKGMDQMSNWLFKPENCNAAVEGRRMFQAIATRRVGFKLKRQAALWAGNQIIGQGLCASQTKVTALVAGIAA